MEGFLLLSNKERKIEDYLRVTEVLSPFSGLDQIDPIVLENAARRGTNVHLALDAFIEGLPMKIEDPSYGGYLHSALGFLLKKNFVTKPKRFFDDDLMITGECDAIYKDESGLVLVDFKTSSKESKTWMLQGSAYAHLARKAGYDIKRIEFVHLLKDGKPCKIYEYEEDFELYLKCLDVYRYFFEKKGRLLKQSTLKNLKKGSL